jgi:ankyrin repeat protein
VLTPRSFAEKDLAKHVARLVQIMTASPINVEELRHFFEKPDRQVLLQRLPAGALRVVVQAPDARALKTLLELGARPDVTDDTGRTPLHWAVEANCPDALLELLSVHPDVNAPDALGRTALHVAVERNAQPLIELLLAHGADPNRADVQGTTPRGLAEQQATGLAELAVRLQGHP